MKAIQTKYFLSLLLCIAMLLGSLLPVTAAETTAVMTAEILIDAEAGTVTIPVGVSIPAGEIAEIEGYDPAYTVINYGSVTDGGAFDGNITNYGEITGGDFSGTVVNAAEKDAASGAAVAGEISGGSFSGSVKNAGVNALIMPSITDGTFTGEIDNAGYITGGVFEESSSVYNHFLGLKGGVFKGTVRTERYSINGGTFSGAVILEHLGSIANGNFTETATVTQKTPFTFILGGRFHCPIDNIGTISGGSFEKSVRNSGKIDGGSFYGDVVNEASGEITSEDHIFHLTKLYGNVENNGLIYACDFGEDATLTGDGDTYAYVTFYTITGMLFGPDMRISNAIPTKAFKYGENVREALTAYCEQQGYDVSWLRFAGVYDYTAMFAPCANIEEDRPFELQATENRFVWMENTESDHDDHAWSEPRFAWAADGAAVTAIFTCTTGETRHTRCLPATVSDATEIAPTCTENGGISYTASVSFDGSEYTSTKQIEDPTRPATGHDYKDEIVPPTYEEDGYTKHTCQNCGESYRDSFVPKLTALPGDVNGDGKMNIEDVTALLLYLSDPESVTLVRGDVNGDGKVSIMDLTRLLILLEG